MNIEVNNVYVSDCLPFMQGMDSNSVDMVLTSPPYDNLRKYDGYSFDFFPIARELYRIMKEGSVMVWIVGDQTVDGSETGESFRQALGFMDVGFKLHDTMIYVKDSRYPQKNRYASSFEYMFILTKGNIKTFNPLKRKTLNTGMNKFITNRTPEGELKENYYTSTYESPLFNVWYYSSGFMKTTKDVEAYEHPAIFPDQLAGDHILSWSNKGDIVFDPFCGSGTTCKMAKRYGRNYIGCDISERYIEIARNRIDNTFALDVVGDKAGIDIYEEDE